MEQETKICSRCKIEQSITKFRFTDKNKIKRKCMCNKCNNARPQNKKGNSTKYYKNNIEIRRQKQRDYVKNKRLKDPLFKLKGNIRNLVCSSFRTNNIRKNNKTFQILGCTSEQFKKYIENQFDVNMNWDNYGSYWSIDHIKPISLAENENDLFVLNHFTNLRPLEKIENIIKSNHY